MTQPNRQQSHAPGGTSPDSGTSRRAPRRRVSPVVSGKPSNSLLYVFAMVRVLVTSALGATVLALSSACASGTGIGQAGPQVVCGQQIGGPELLAVMQLGHGSLTLQSHSWTPVQLTSDCKHGLKVTVDPAPAARTRVLVKAADTSPVILEVMPTSSQAFSLRVSKGEHVENYPVRVDDAAGK